MQQENSLTPHQSAGPWDMSRKVVYIIGTLALFVFSLDLMISSLQHMGKTAAETILLATSNPFTGLFIGLLVTAMVQSSSTTTSLVVALVASGSISLDSAIPIIMGANIGTTITSTIVSLGFINRKKEFRRAVAAGTYHDFFNILTALILFPLEYYYGFLSGLSVWATENYFTLTRSEGSNALAWLGSGFAPVINWLVTLIPSGFLLALLSFVLLFSSILLFRRLISGMLMARSPQRFSRFFFKSALKSFMWGLLTTGAIRSSSITTSVVVPIVAQKIISLRKAAPFILGANIGTTVTAFFAALLNASASSAISIAFAHFLFNVIGVIIFSMVPVVREMPLWLAQALGRNTLRYRLAGFVYILLTFFFIPFSLIYLNRDSTEVLEVTYKKTDHVRGHESTYRMVSKLNNTNKNGEWLLYRKNSAEPDEIIPLHTKNQVLFINKEMILFNSPGFCWDGAGKEGKTRLCVVAIHYPFSINEQAINDSVYHIRQHLLFHPDTVVHDLYITKNHPLLVKQTTTRKNTLVETIEILSIEHK